MVGFRDYSEAAAPYDRAFAAHDRFIAEHSDGEAELGNLSDAYKEIVRFAHATLKRRGLLGHDMLVTMAQQLDESLSDFAHETISKEYLSYAYHDEDPIIDWAGVGALLVEDGGAA